LIGGEFVEHRPVLLAGLDRLFAHPGLFANPHQAFFRLCHHRILLLEQGLDGVEEFSGIVGCDATFVDDRALSLIEAFSALALTRFPSFVQEATDYSNSVDFVSRYRKKGGGQRAGAERKRSRRIEGQKARDAH
jgi:hypothetical protein